jgi:hypothetical protein
MGSFNVQPLVTPQDELRREARHRNNAAEWCLWTLLLPLVPIVWMFERVKRR